MLVLPASRLHLTCILPASLLNLSSISPASRPHFACISQEEHISRDGRYTARLYDVERGEWVALAIDDTIP